MTAQPRSSEPAVVKVALDNRAYDIVIGRGVLNSLGARMKSLRAGAKAAVITDANVAKLHLKAAKSALGEGGHTEVEVPPGEHSKDYATFAKVCEALIAAKIERNDLVVALGGGVIGDLAGFAAASVRRGLDFIQVPTTLLAQVDSSVGGKTGIDSPQGKNLIGAFHQPLLVLADTALLDTLPKREFVAGYAEMVKYGLLADAGFFAWLESNWQDVFAGGPGREHAIAVACRGKAAVVARDERESGERALLNLGHTFGHALEADAGFSGKLLHGEAVAIGIVMAFEFSVKRGLISAEAAARVVRHFKASGLPVRVTDMFNAPPDLDRLMALIAQDKKVKRGKLTFILVRDIGNAFVENDVDPAEVRSFLAEQLSSSR
jgi:3-dehydroquinate synthase